MNWYYDVTVHPDLDDPYFIEMGPFSQRHEAELSRQHEVYPYVASEPYQR